MLTTKALGTLDKIRHGFFTRRGGQSSGLYESLNCALGTEDDPSSVIHNRSVCALELGVEPQNLVTLRQEHTAKVEVVVEPWPSAESPVADAMVTNQAGIALGILTADCAPVLFADAKAGVIGAAHAGWKGALGGVIANTVTEMVSLGADIEEIRAAVGPCIGFESYEVGPEFKERIAANDQFRHDTYFRPSANDGHAYFDLSSFVADRVTETGITHLASVEADTCANEHTFFSYRRSCHRNEPDYGRQLSGIALVS